MDNMKGFVTFEDKKYPFSFSNKRLELYPDKFDSQFRQELFNYFERGKTIKDIELHGVTANRNNVVFEVSEQYSDNDGFLSFNVYSIYEYDSLRYQVYMEDDKQKYHTKETAIRGIKIRGVDIDLFYPPEKVYSIDYTKKDKALSTVYVNRIMEVPLGKIEWKGTEVVFSAQYTVSRSFSATPLHSSSEIVVMFGNAVSLDFVKEIYNSVFQTFRYLTRRNNIVFDSIEVFDINEKQLREKFGKYYDLRHHHEKETNKKMKQRVLNYDCVGEQFARLVKSFLDGIIYIDHLPDNLDKVNKFGPDRMLFDFVAFEREYANLYPEAEVRSDKYLEAKKVALEALDRLVEQKTGKVKKYLATFRKRVAADENSLSDRLLLVIKDCEAIMKPFLIYELGKEYDVSADGITPLEDVASKMNTLRNDMAHGNLDIRLDKWHIFGFAIIETLLYAMRLKALGIDERKIQEGLIQVMGYNFLLDK
nr:hypothetical protein [uncultured Blautia sp.]